MMFKQAHKAHISIYIFQPQGILLEIIRRAQYDKSIINSHGHHFLLPAMDVFYERTIQMNDNNWFDINEIANYLQAKIGDNQVSKSTLRRWIKAEADHSHDPQATKTFTTSALGSKKPVTKYSLALVNAMIEHNLNRIQNKTDVVPPALMANLSTSSLAAMQKEVTVLNDRLQQLQNQFQKLDALAQRQYRQQLWLQISQVKLSAERQGQQLDAQSLYQDMLNDDFHDDINHYLVNN